MTVVVKDPSWTPDWKGATHDYDPIWDYEVDEQPPAEVVKCVRKQIKEYAPLLRLLELPPVEVHFVNEGGKLVGTYVHGTSGGPVIILIDGACIMRVANEDPYLDLWEGVTTTLLHELGHAYLEAQGCRTDEWEHDEDVIEDFVHRVYDWDDFEGGKALLDAEAADCVEEGDDA